MGNKEILICKGPNDVCRIYQTAAGFELRYNLLWDGDPTYIYKTLAGAKIAMRNFSRGRYKNSKPSTAWE